MVEGGGGVFQGKTGGLCHFLPLIMLQLFEILLFFGWENKHGG